MAEDAKAEVVRQATTTWGLFALEHGLLEVVPDLSGEAQQDKMRLTISGALMLRALAECMPDEMPRSQRNVVLVALTNVAVNIRERCIADGEEMQPRPPLCVRQDKPSNIVIARG